MTRRANLPGAAELFRATGLSGPEPALPSPPMTSAAGADVRPDAHAVGRPGERGPSGRQRHAEKITVYCSPAELVDLERARLALRADHGLAVDRGRIVREALDVVLADLDAKGDESILVRRLRQARPDPRERT